MPVTHHVTLDPESRMVAPEVITLPRDERLMLVISVVAPTADANVETLEIKADNQQAGYWSHRDGPNLFISVECDENGKHTAVPLKIYSSGSSQSLREHSCSVALELRDAPDVRHQRIASFLRANGADDGAVAYFENYYIGNPVGTYDVGIEYRPTTGAFAGRKLIQRLRIVVNDGPDSLDRMAK